MFLSICICPSSRCDFGESRFFRSLSSNLNRTRSCSHFQVNKKKERWWPQIIKGGTNMAKNYPRSIDKEIWQCIHTRSWKCWHSSWSFVVQKDCTNELLSYYVAWFTSCELQFKVYIMISVSFTWLFFPQYAICLFHLTKWQFHLNVVSNFTCMSNNMGISTVWF